MPSGQYDHKGIRHDAENIDPIFCRCGIKWGEHPTDWSPLDIKPNCCICNEEIGIRKNKYFIPNQCEVRYKEKGNYCDKCNGKCHTVKSSNLLFNELFKNKPK